MRLIRLDLQWRGRLRSYMWMDGMGWDGGMGIIGRRQSKSTFGANIGKQNAISGWMDGILDGWYIRAFTMLKQKLAT